MSVYRNHEFLPILKSPHYAKHVLSMTKEDLHSKADIAEELAARDIQIEELKQQLAEYRDTVAQQAELLAAHKAEIQDWQRGLLKAQQERDEYKKDAERYRWLLSSARITDALWRLINSKFTEDERHINNAIDAAMKGVSDGR